MTPEDAITRTKALREWARRRLANPWAEPHEDEFHGEVMAVLDTLLSTLSGQYTEEQEVETRVDWKPIATVPRDKTRVLVWMTNGTFSGAEYDRDSQPRATHWCIPTPPAKTPPPDATGPAEG